MGNDNKIRIGIIGAGNIGSVHATEFSKLADECEITAITDAYIPLAEAKAKEFGIAKVLANPEELIDQSRCRRRHYWCAEPVPCPACYTRNRSR